MSFSRKYILIHLTDLSLNHFIAGGKKMAVLLERLLYYSHWLPASAFSLSRNMSPLWFVTVTFFWKSVMASASKVSMWFWWQSDSSSWFYMMVLWTVDLTFTDCHTWQQSCCWILQALSFFKLFIIHHHVSFLVRWKGFHYTLVNMLCLIKTESCSPERSSLTLCICIVYQLSVIEFDLRLLLGNQLI